MFQVSFDRLIDMHRRPIARESRVKRWYWRCVLEVLGEDCECEYEHKADSREGAVHDAIEHLEKCHDLRPGLAGATNAEEVENRP